MNKCKSVKLTQDQWRLAIEAIWEWGELCVAEAESVDGTVCGDMHSRGLLMQKIAGKINLQTKKKSKQPSARKTSPSEQ